MCEETQAQAQKLSSLPCLCGGPCMTEALDGAISLLCCMLADVWQGDGGQQPEFSVGICHMSCVDYTLPRSPCRYAALEGRGALSMKGTLVAQGARSRYALTEARVGGALTRHDLSIQQVRVPPAITNHPQLTGCRPLSTRM